LADADVVGDRLTVSELRGRVERIEGRLGSPS
jgi:hypothetical protein